MDNADTSNGGMSRPADNTPDEGALDPELEEIDWPKAGRRFAPTEQYDRYDPYDQGEEYEEQRRQEEEPLRRELAQFAFVREEDDREVRLTFRDTPADSIAKAFRDSGAYLISMTGQRAQLAPTPAAAEPSSDATAETDALAGRRRRHRRGHNPVPPDSMPTAPTHSHRHTGELTMRYFFSLRETVYTINIASTTGVVESIAHIYPSAFQCEREIQSRVAVLFREIRS